MKKETKRSNTPRITATVILGILAAINLVGMFWGREGLLFVVDIIFGINIFTISCLGVWYDKKP